MEIYAHTGGPVDTNGYLVVDEASRQAVAIDAPEGAAAAFAERAERDGLQVLRLVLTHGHWDHIFDALFFRRAFQCPITIHPADAFMLQVPQTELFGLPFSIPPFEADEELNDGETLALESLQLTVIHTPGHSPGGICLHAAEHGILFAGDTLFAGSYGRLDLPGSDSDAMAESLTRLAALPADTTVYSGHGPSTTIGVEAGWMRAMGRGR
jgi:glyoxylase-like metal-dependent hydrolase (beta-lactamase superfamily II)